MSAAVPARSWPGDPATDRPGPGLPEAAYAVALTALDGLGPKGLRALLGQSRPSVAWSAVLAGHPADKRRQWRRSAEQLDVAALWARHQAHGIGAFVLGQPGYPGALAADHEAPAVLYGRGDLGSFDGRRRVALVGTRTPTRYGMSVAAQLAGELTTAGISVVSGLAAGIDGAAHEGACAAVDAGAPARCDPGPPVAVVANGLDRAYPASHAGLFDRVAARGVVVSECPAGIPPARWRFVLRNRILAGLADVVVVVECHLGGGALHTVRAAERRGITVGAVPGSIRSPASAGTNDLLADGCLVVRDLTDILVALDLATAGEVPVRPPIDRSGSGRASGPAGSPAPPAPVVPDLAGPDVAVLEALGWDPAGLDQLMAATGLALAAVSQALEHLCAAGLAVGGGGVWQRSG